MAMIAYGVYLAGMFAMLTGNSFHFNLGLTGLLLPPVFIVPVVHLFVSTSRMKRECESTPDVFDMPYRRSRDGAAGE